MKYEPMNEWMNECHVNFASFYKPTLNVFSMHNINVWKIMTLGDFHS
jgi:hypothetical protein